MQKVSHILNPALSALTLEVACPQPDEEPVVCLEESCGDGRGVDRGRLLAGLSYLH